MLFGFVPIPLSVEEVELWVCDYPSCVEVIVVAVWLSAQPSLCRGGFIRERSCVLLFCIFQILGGGPLCGRSCVDIQWKSFCVKVGT